MDNSKDTELRQIARLRLARVLIDQGKPDEAIKTLAEPMPAAFAARYHEVRGDALLCEERLPATRSTEYQAALGGGRCGRRGCRRCWNLKIARSRRCPRRRPQANSADTPNKAKP